MIFVIVCDFIIPVVMIILGMLYRNHYPKKINNHHGYRTTRSMKNQDTWEYSQKIFGKIALIDGVIMLAISIAVVCFSVSKGKDGFAWISFALIMIQIAMMIFVIYLVEKDLKKMK